MNLVKEKQYVYQDPKTDEWVAVKYDGNLSISTRFKEEKEAYKSLGKRMPRKRL